MWLGEKILLLCSRSPDGPDFPASHDQWNDANALDLLRQEFPDYERFISGKAVLDFGCGRGWQSVAMARAGAAYVLGVDTNGPSLQSARALGARSGLATDRICFAEGLRAEHAGRFDVVISQNSFEHFPDPDAILKQLTSALRPRGRLLITFSPPWFAPYGSHASFFTKVPWVHLLFSERTIMRVRSRFRSDGAQRYQDVEGGLNGMTVARFERLVRASGLRVEWKRYRCVKGLNFLGGIPGIRELFINAITSALAKAA